MITVLAKSSPPGVPEAVNIGKTYADLKWEPPKHDGGAKITGNNDDESDGESNNNESDDVN